MKNILDIIIEDQEIRSFLTEREKSYLAGEVGFKNFEQNTDVIEKIFRIEYLFLNQLLTDGVIINTQIDLFNTAYSILKSYDIYDSNVSNVFTKVFGVDDLENDNLYYFYLASLALSSDKTIRIRLDLQDYKIGYKAIEELDWKKRVLNKLFESFILLVRKKDGFADIGRALEIIADLKIQQKKFEQTYLDSYLEKEDVLDKAHFLLGLYHLSKTITETADYLTQGYNYSGRLESEIRIHSEIAKKLFQGHQRIQDFVDIFERNLKLIHQNSIWFNTNSIQARKLKEFCVLKSKAERSLIELLPSQKKALNDNLLNIAANVTVVEMPTSAGKTLLAEFNIIVTKALNEESKVVYIVPSRALVNQVYYDLKDDLSDLGFVIEKTSSAIEIDPSEESLLSEKIDILVSTPEKLDLLIRRKHKSVDEVALFVIDEAHMLQNGERGAKLELLLAILKRERPNSKFMLLSPFLKGSAEEIANWIGGEKIRTSINVNWRPSEKMLIGISKKKDFKVFSQTLLPSAYSSITDEINLPISVIDINKPLSGRPREKYIEFVSRNYGAKNKSILFLCEGAGMVDQRAKFLNSVIDERDESENIKLVKNFIQDEVGRQTVLSSVLEKRIALHHAGLSDESKLLIEYLIRQKEINFIFATSTLAEGVNFPVSSVYFDSYEKGSGNTLTANDFWNISGRAGRTMIDNYGKLLFPFDSKKNEKRARDLINDSSEKIASVLLTLLVDADAIINQISNSEKNPIYSLLNKYSESLSPLIQYLIHLLNTASNNNYLEVEDLFKDSLGYFQLTSKEQKDKFIQVCKSIYQLLQTKFNKGTMAYADKTGFSVPSVLEIMRSENKNNPSIASAESWKPENLFNYNNNFMTEKIKVIAKLKETQLGTDSQSSEFNPEAVAKVLISWVKGDQLYDVSSYHPTFSAKQNDADRINSFIKYINSARFKASWGLSALEGIINSKGDEIENNSYVPSLVYYGVDSKESLLMRMVGVPRRLAKSMSKIIENENPSLTQIRTKIKNLQNNDWDSLKPSNSLLSGMEWKRLTEILVR
ncbi:DEAD/DEAH box helicase [Leptospira weilii]|uniref:DEAD/DEAH box helicase n=1 Tax=Leptospira weilii TaxID=28184 RepID=UPI00256F4509|nr:DEAD/DEAH box helicase [Leptospira weilii]MDL5247126.1 DEAD/DEAH box helicase [Leptospira weilii]